MNAQSDLDPTLCREAVAPFLGSEMFALKTVNVFFGARLTHTNVHVTLRDVTYAQAKDAVEALKILTGKSWNAPSQDSDEVENLLGDKSTLGMFTTDGALLLHVELDRIEGYLRQSALSSAKLTEAVEDAWVRVAANGHGEVYDTAVREEVWHRLDRVLEEIGLERPRR